MSKRKSILIAFLAVLCAVLLLAGVYVGFHRFSSVSGSDLDGLARQAADHFGTGDLSITKTAQRGDYFAALCTDNNGSWYMCEYDKDKLFSDRWRANGGTRGFAAGELVSWNFGTGGDVVLIFCGAQLPDNVLDYSFINSGVTYSCPVKDHTVLDIFIIPDSHDISSVPVAIYD